MDSPKESFIKKWLKDFLELDELLPFEENEQTIECLLDVISDIDEKRKQSEILKREQIQEIKEFQADKTRMDSILKDLELDINFGLTPKAKRYMNTLSAAVGELGISQASQPSMVAAVTHLHDQLQQSSIELGQSSESHDILSEQCNEVERITTQLLKQFEALELQLPAEKKKVESLQKSTKFHAQKKKQYEEKISEFESRLDQSGFCRSLSHGAIVKLGETARDLEARLRPRVSQLSSFHELPADLNLAQVKLHEAVQELHRVEDEIHHIFHEMGAKV